MKRLFIDLEVCNKHPGVAVPCSYFYHPDNKGVISLREIATFAIICRQCDEAPCVKSCPQDALEKQGDGTIICGVFPVNPALLPVLLGQLFLKLSLMRCPNVTTALTGWERRKNLYASDSVRLREWLTTGR